VYLAPSYSAEVGGGGYLYQIPRNNHMKRYAYIDRIKRELIESQTAGTPMKKKKLTAIIMLMGASRRLTAELIQMFIDSERIKEVEIESELCLIWKPQEAE